MIQKRLFLIERVGKFMKLTMKEAFSIPNLLCYVRLIMIPIFSYLYINADSSRDYFIAAIVVLVASLTDFFDGFIARKYNMITEWGKFLDPLADKLMQAAMLFMLIVKVKWMFLLIILFIFKEGFMATAGIVMLNKGRKLNGAKWFGKVSTAVFYVIMLVLIALPSLNNIVVNLLLIICACFLTLSFVLYIKEYILMYRELKNQ